MRDYLIDEFTPAIGEAFDVDLGGARVSLTLDDVMELPRSLRGTGSYRLEFRGPRDPLLPQAIYRFERGGESWDIFIVPIAQDEESSTYEAIFN